MLKLIVVSALLLISIMTTAPTKKPVSDGFCKICKKVIDEFITGDDFIKNDEKITDAICAKFLTGPMVQVCAAGIIGEIDFIRDTYNDDPNAICVAIGCPSKGH
ncbi:hypothetical protein PRIPAC_86231 [Pristionchus pacificus]|uniref:Uncharacterized protein n=1 Tax=Pristionchus pacificus TaxID=54126 RepID=A0A454XJ92_PRIPA|nr:hypothetical protein PRIPAC_86231 [Pristionchus pacificus]|eukprot:PDM67128.1 hypothetical protein PRIPAC_48545 [Pristionchus pacificus]